MNTLRMILRAFSPLLLCSQLATAPAWAQSDPKAAAHDHYEKGIAAFDDERFQDAADEFEAAYRISPAFAVLYNLGRVYVALGRPVEAVHAFETYLAQGAAAVDRTRVKEVRAEIEKQRTRIGTITVRTTPPSAEVRVDGQLVGKTPLAKPVLVSAGKHTVEAILSGYAPLVRELSVNGMAQIELDLPLERVVQPESNASPGKSPSDQVPPPPVAAPPAPAAPPAAPASVTAPTPAAAPLPAAAAAYAAPEGPSSARAMRTWGYVVGAVGVLGGAAGAVVAVTGYVNANDARNRAVNATAPDATGQYDQARSDFESARSLNVVGWVMAGIGAGVLLGGALLVAIAPAPSSSAPVAAIAPWIGVGGGGGAFSCVW